MDLRQLDIFCKVVEQKSFSAAGKLVRLSQPTVSSHIKELETRLKCRLIDRLSRRAVPTQAGELFYRYAIQVLALCAEAETAVTAHRGEIRGKLHIGGSTIPGGYILPRVIGGFKEKYPAVVPTLIIGDTGKILDELLAGGLEVGMVGARTEEQRILQEKIWDDELGLIIPARHKWWKRKSIPMPLLLQEPFILRESGSGTLKSLEASMKKCNLPINTLSLAAVMGSTEAVIQGIKAGVGVSILSKLAVADELEKGSLKALPVDAMDLKRSFYLSRHRHRSLSPVAGAFIDFLKSMLKSSYGLSHRPDGDTI